MGRRWMRTTMERILRKAVERPFPFRVAPERGKTKERTSDLSHSYSAHGLGLNTRAGTLAGSVVDSSDCSGERSELSTSAAVTLFVRANARVLRSGFRVAGTATINIRQLQHGM